MPTKQLIALNGFGICDGCELQCRKESPRDGRCAECAHMYRNMSFPYRDWKRSAGLERYRKGAVLQGGRMFGIEVEAKFRYMVDVRRVLHAVDRNIGACQDAGAEFQTPPSRGLAAEEMIGKLAAEMRGNGFRCEDGCGYHLHVDGSDLDFMAVRNLYLLYILFDGALRTLISPYRRTSSWCDPTKDRFDEVMGAGTMGDIEGIYYSNEVSYELKRSDIEEFKGDRKSVHRRGFNLQCLFADGHLEIRYHESTLDEQEILHWANLHCLIMDAARTEIADEWFLWVRKGGGNGLRVLFDLIGLSLSGRRHFYAKGKAEERRKKVRDAAHHFLNSPNTLF